LTNVGDVKQTTVFYDGVGRPLQVVAMQGSLASGSSATDLVSPHQYDPAGREVFTYLPYVSANTDGSFKANAMPEQNVFNASQFQSQGENFYYKQMDFETSPLARTNGASAAGDSWTGSNRSISHLYTSNTDLDKVVMWNVSNSGTAGVFGSYTLGGGYASGTLSKEIITDESGKETIQFRDFAGQLILKKVQLSAPPDDGTGSGYNGWLCTYYIYDIFGNLRCIVQPHGVELLYQNNWSFSALSNIILNEQCFRYEYDQRRRMIMKQVPGAGAAYMVYDNLDRLVMSQDANLRAIGQWKVSVYETTLNRQVATGLYTTSTAFGTLLTTAAASSSYPFTLSTAPAYPIWEMLTQTHYDNYNGLPSGISGTLSTSTINMSNFYTNYNTSPLYAQPLTQSTPSTSITTQGLVTWIQSEVLGSGGAQYISSANIYNLRGELIQKQTLNYSGGLDLVTTQYNFLGKALISDLRHQKYSSGNPTPQTYEIATRNTYDALNRPMKLEQMIIASVIPSPAWKTVSTTSYDVLGHPKVKTIGNDPINIGQPLENITFDYNIRNWLLGVNRSYINNPSPTNAFGYELGYDKPNTIVAGTTYATPSFNGNIAGVTWKDGGDGAIRKYDFSYDAANRFMGADFNQYNSSGFNRNDGLNFSVTGLGYDANGNLTQMTQNGWKAGASGPIDILTYTPVTNTNRLQNVKDDATDPTTPLGDFRYSASYAATLPAGKSSGTVDYSYDNNGNLIADKNKDISSITYNFLNLPVMVTIAGINHNGTITYTYDASGEKLAKKVNETGATVAGVSTDIITTTSYTTGFVYNSLQYSSPSLASQQYTDKLGSFSHDEGRVRALYLDPLHPFILTGFAFDYFLKDHLGNTRVVLTEETQTDPYPTLNFEGTTTDAVANQNAMWDNSAGQPIDVLSRHVTPLPTGFTAATNGTYCASITKSQGAIGAGKLIRVMAKDQLNVSIDYTYSSAVDNSNANGMNTLLNSLAGMILGSNEAGSLIKNTTAANALATAQNNATVSNFISVVNQEVPGSGGAPKAYLHILLFNSQFVFDNVNSVVTPITTAGLNVRQTITKVVAIPKDGYAYIYFSNESNTTVYFDNFNLTHVRGPILETTSYYPFGLAMAGISDKALKTNYGENKYKFQKQELQNLEFNDGSGLEMYEFKYRFDDPQIGRFWQIDPLTDSFPHNSTYAFSENKVTSHVELEGLESLTVQDLWRSAGITESKGQEIAQSVTLGMQKAGRVSQDVLIITGGVLILVATDGAAAPLFVTASADLAIAGGSTKLILDAQGRNEESDAIPSTVSGTVVFSINAVVGPDSKGNKLLSNQFLATVEFTEGIATLKFSGLSKLSAAEKASVALSGVSLLLASKDVPENVKAILRSSLKSNTSTNAQTAPVSDHLEDRLYKYNLPTLNRK
jgi:hypothetical protein